MLEAGEAELAARAERLRAAAAASGAAVEIVRAAAKAGGGALPLLELEGPVVAVDPGAAGADALASALRHGDRPVIARIHEGRVLLDPRTLTDEEADEAGATLAPALARIPNDAEVAGKAAGAALRLPP
jgi:L-seryl-tRNA(Ser) seleniumtransferase